jgi:hypothetical protein
MLVAHRLNPVFAVFIVAAVGIGSVMLILHAISSVDFAATATAPAALQ